MRGIVTEPLGTANRRDGKWADATAIALRKEDWRNFIHLIYSS